MNKVYECKCGFIKRLETDQKIKPLKNCPNCGAELIEKK